MKHLFTFLACCLPIYLLAQGFGSFSHDQPFFAKDVVSGENLTNIITSVPGLYRWWVASDVPTNHSISNQWLDRVYGEVMGQGDASVRPTNTSQGIHFDGTTWLTNVALNVTNQVGGTSGDGDDHTNLFLYIIQTDTDGNLMDLWVNDKTGNEFRGSRIIRDLNHNWGYYDNSTIPRLYYGKPPYPDNYPVDLMFLGPCFYINGEVSSNNPVAGIVGNSDMQYLGSEPGGFNKFKGYIKEIIVWTNINTGIPMPSATASNIHYYYSTMYGYSNVPPQEYMIRVKLDADVGVSNSTYTAASNGEEVFRWWDQSAWRWDLIKGVSGAVFTNSGPNGLPYINFPYGENRSLVNVADANVSVPQTNTYIFVMKFNPRNSANGSFFEGSDTTYTAANVLEDYQTKKLGLYAGANLSGTDGDLVTNVWTVVTAQFNGANTYVRTNGVLYVSGNAGTRAQYGFRLGTAANNTSHSFPSIASMRYYTGPMTSNLVYEVESELATKYNITIP